MTEKTNKEFYELRRVANRLTQVEIILSFIRVHFPLNELSSLQWDVLESLADTTRVPLIKRVVTYRLCQTIEHCRDNGLSMVVTRYLELNPARRQVLLRKTVRLISTLIPLEMHLKSYSPVAKF